MNDKKKEWLMIKNKEVKQQEKEEKSTAATTLDSYFIKNTKNFK